MFELLLQADRALADGSLDQAERTYWQLIDLDPTNAIAVAGLARISLERGDEKAAREFADRALGIDPDSIAARRVIETLTHTGAEHAGPEPTALPLLGAERLEALSRRRSQGDATEEDGAVKAGGQGRRTTRPKAVEPRVSAPVMPPARAAGKGAGTGRKAAKPAANATDAASRGRTRPDQIGPLPSEPLQERRKAGRLAAAAAAAAAAAREPVRPRHEPHHAMPIGRRFFGLEDLKTPTADDFSAAEMAAAIEAVDALDEPDVVEPMIHSRPGPARDIGVGDQADLLGAVDATAADESIALRIALVAGTNDLEAAEREAARVVDEEASDAFEAAEAIASSALHGWDTPRLETRPRIAGFDADEFEAAEAEAEAAMYAADHAPIPAPALTSHPSEPAVSAVEASPAAFAEFGNADADADAAEAAAVAEAVQEVSEAEAAMDAEPVTARKSFPHHNAEEPSEEDAETQALREALAMVLQGDGDAEDVDAAVSRHRTAGAASPAKPDPGPAPKPEPERAAEPAPKPEPAVAPASEPRAEPESTPAADTTAATESNPESTPRKGGLFHRIKR